MVQAGKSLVRSENVSDALWRGISNETCRDADHLFKLIGKAYAMLSDTTMVCITEF
jgi:DnaJ homolog subfamily C member 7